MARTHGISLAIFCFLIGSALADWNYCKISVENYCKISLENYCESWRINVEIHNIRGFEVVPDECVALIGKYMTSTQYKVDSDRTIQEAAVYLKTSCDFKKDGKDAWIFDIDDTLLSTVPYYKENGFGGNKLNTTSLEEWMKQGRAPGLVHSLKLFNELKWQGVQIILVSSRMEHLRSATVDNLVNQGFFGWTSLILRGAGNVCKDIQGYKSDVRKKLISDGNRIWAIVGDQWSSIEGLPSAKRTFKLPNPMYFAA